MPTANDELLDAMLRHQIGLLRLSRSVSRDIVRLLNATERDLRDRIERRLSRVTNSAGVNVTRGLALRQLEALERDIRSIRGSAFAETLSLWESELRNMVVAEAQFLDMALRTVSPTILDLTVPDGRRLRGLVTTDPFRGRVLRAWARGLEAGDRQRIMDQIRIGLVEGQPVRDIARRVVGTARLGGTDGVTRITRQQAEAITRTSVNHFANRSRKDFYLANSDIIDEEMYVATLDGRTTAICRALDGRIFPVGEGERPPLHFNCRSLRVAIIDGQVIGARPMKPTTERGLLREFTRQRGISTVASRASLPRGFKGDFDAFARRRTRELVGRVPAKVNYQQFLERQSREFQDDVLGSTKARLFRDGNLRLDRFVDRAGNELSLRDLAIRDRQAFLDAGLDPDSFLQAA